MTWALFSIFDSFGTPLVRHQYRPEVKWKDCGDIFHEIVTKRSEFDEPLIYKNDLTAIYSTKKGLFMCLVTRQNANVNTGYSFLTNIYSLIQAYTGAFSASVLRENATLVRELLDEAMDFGHPQITDFRLLREYISGAARVKTYEAPAPPAAVTNAVSNRPAGLVYRSNEIFVDVVEELKFKQTASGNVTQNEVLGSIGIHTRLSGFPEVKLMLSGKFAHFVQRGESAVSHLAANGDFKFHPCVYDREALRREGAEPSVVFHPPDGRFSLMSYCVPCAHDRLFSAQVTRTELAGNQVRYRVVFRALFPPPMMADKVTLSFGVEPSLDSPRFEAVLGAAAYKAERDAVSWKLSNIGPQTAAALDVVFRRFAKQNAASPSVDKSDLGSPSGARLAPFDGSVRVKFSMQFASLSGIEVLALSVFEKSNYPVAKFITYLAKSGSVQLN